MTPFPQGREAAALWQVTLDAMTAHVAVLDETGRIIAVNDAWRRFSMRRGNGADFVGSDYLAVCRASGEPFALKVAVALAEMIRGERHVLEVEYPCHGPGERRWFVLRATVYRGERHLRILVAHEETTALHAAQDRAVLNSRLLDQIDASVIVIDAEQTVLSWNSGAEQLYGWPREDAVGAWLPSLIAPMNAPDEQGLCRGFLSTDTAEGEYDVRHRDGTPMTVYARTRVVNDDFWGRSVLVGVSIDVSERKAGEQAVRATRNFLQAVADNMGDGLFTIDCEGRVTYANHVAQELLGWSADEMRHQIIHELVHTETVSGDPLPYDECPITQANRAGTQVRVADDVFIRRDGSRLPVAYTAAPFDTEDGTLGCAVVFRDITARKREQEQLRRNLEKLEWVQRVQDALVDQRFVLYAQPIINLRSGQVVQRELLIRMDYPPESGVASGLISPGQFLPVAEEYGFITDIDRWVVDQAAAIAAGGFPAELNVSARSVADPTFIGHVRHALARTGADPSSLVFEITETALIADQAAAGRFVDQLHGIGCKIALDDFGTGYGGFTYLKQLPIDYLKIDVEFVRDLRHNDASRNVVQAVVNLARGFGITTVAEGVEDEETLASLQGMGVDYAQGFYIGRPAPIACELPA